MKVKLVPVLMAALFLTVGSGCQRSNLEIGPAPIHELRVDISKSKPPQVSVYIKGGLRDTCTSFRNIVTSRDNNNISIAVTVQKPKNQICGQLYSFFEKNVNLGSNFISGQSYIVNVNDNTTSFVMP